MKPQLLLRSLPRRPSSARTQLLTYPMAFTQPHATVPLLSSGGRRNTSRGSPASTHVQLRAATKEFRCSDNDDGGSNESNVVNPHRWVRDPDELCVASVRRSKNINKVNTYVATYKFDDPQWAPLLLPQVTVRPQQSSMKKKKKNENGNEKNEEDVETCNHSGTSFSSPPPPNLPPNPPGSSSASSHNNDDNNNDLRHRVVIDHNKLLTLECMSRHVNFSLRHIVQKGHGVYLLHHAQHSVVRPKGIIEQSFVTCSFGIKGERLRTDILHVGPLDANDVLDVQEDSRGRVRAVFNLRKPDVPRGVVAASQVEGYGTWFQRKPMLWQRSRRIGALQSQLGAFMYDLLPPHEVGKRRDCEVSLLAPHVRFFGGGAEAVGIIASSQVAQQEKLYLGEFEAPAMTALDAVHQLAHATALRSSLVTPLGGTVKGGDCRTDGGDDDDGGNKNKDEDTLETLVPVSWATRTPPPYVPLEADLPFKLQISKPAVFGAEQQEQHPVVYPTGGTVGSPFVRGAPIMLFEYNMHQGVDHYVYDDAPSARPMKWWSQKSNMPYSGYMFFVRGGVVDRLSPTEEIANPFERAAQRRPLHTIVPPTKRVQRRVGQYKQRLREATRKKGAKETTAAAHVHSEGSGKREGGKKEEE